MAAELGLHHITVKNFFSNGRRRLRRAAARLNDPERTRRENQRRKEKRRLAALAASLPGGEKLQNAKTGDHPEVPAKDPPVVLSPERRALMEKLAVKVQRSVAQKAAQPFNRKPQLMSPCTQIVDSISSHTHSNINSLLRDLNDPIQVVPVTTSVTYLNPRENKLINILSYSADKQHFNFPSDTTNSPQCNLEGSNSFLTSTFQVDRESYSPTNWQTLLNA